MAEHSRKKPTVGRFIINMKIFFVFHYITNYIIMIIVRRLLSYFAASIVFDAAFDKSASANEVMVLVSSGFTGSPI